ncbi:MAG: hypothetical protein PSX81_10500 [bacterium]|nr:hypothetical protein [bacterium]
MAQSKRDIAYLKLSNEEKWEIMMRVNKLAIAFNNGRPIKKPQGKGIVFNQKGNGLI